MYQKIEPASAAAKGPYWTRIMTFLRSLEEAVGRTETDDLIDRIDALERRVDALASGAATSGGRTGDRPRERLS